MNFHEFICVFILFDSQSLEREMEKVNLCITRDDEQDYLFERAR